MSSLFLVCFLTGAVGCGDGGGAGAAPLGLGDGTEVRLPEGGGLELWRGDRELLALSGPPSLVQWEAETATGPFAIWSFEREGEQVTSLSRGDARQEADGSVVVDYAGPDGPGAVLRLWPEGGAVRLELTPAAEAQGLRLPVRCDPDGSFHGFGEQYDATEHTGERFTLLVSEQGIGRTGGARAIAGDAHTTYFPMPWWLDARGFGVLLETDWRVEADVCASDPGSAVFEVVGPGPLRARVLPGPTPLEVIDQLGAAVGRPARPPEWAWQTWIGAQGGRQAVLDEADALEAADVPVGALWVQDWTGVRPNPQGGFGVQYRWEADPEHYPDLAGLIDTLHARGLRFLGYANPFVDPALPNHFDEMAAAGLLIQRPDEDVPYVHIAPNLQSSHPDLTDAEAVAYVRDALERMASELGMDGWMADFGEWLPLDARYDGSDAPRAEHNRYPVAWHGVNRAALEAARPDGDWVTFARSGWTGVQAHSQIHWVGDQEATFSETDGLPTVVPALLSLGLAGVPYATHDIGGFSGGPREKEVFLRWTELGALTPVMRTHEGNLREENWDWNSDAETVAHFRRMARLHQALLPEWRALAAEAAATSAPMLRHLMLAYPEDRTTWTVHDEFLVGDELLVAPVLEAGADRRRLYLPAGTWYHLWSGQAYAGGDWVEVDAPLGEPPVFSRDRDRPDLRAATAPSSPGG